MKRYWWHRRSKLEKILAVFTAGFIAIIVALLLVLYNINDAVTTNTCTTPACLAEASKIAASLNENTNPCDDFYEFVCGNFIKNAPNLKHKPSINQFRIISAQILRQLRNILEEIYETPIKPTRLLKDYYEACKNTTVSEAKGLDTIKGIIKSELGGWPVLEHEWNNQNFDWKELNYKFRHLGFDINGIINLKIRIDYNNSTKYSVFLDQPSIGTSKFLLQGMDNPVVKKNYNFMVDIAVIFGADRQKARKELHESLEFETKLANITVPKDNQRNVSAWNNVFTIKELQENFTSIPWLEYINNVIGYSSSKLHLNDTVIVKVPDYFKQLEVLLKQTPKKTQANYLIWSAIKKLARYLNDEGLNRRMKRKLRWQECLVTIKPLNLAMAALFVRKHFKYDARYSAKEMFREIRAEFKRRLKHLDWMDKSTKRAAFAKVNAITEHIGYPDELLDNNKLIDYYKDLEINPKSYFLSVTNMSLFANKKEFEKLQRKVDKTDWREHGDAYDVNALYNPFENSVYIPAGILQGVFFDHDRPKYMNFGSLSFIIGHETIHGFDDQGRMSDKNGNLFNWWSEAAAQSFIKKAQCFIEQYGNYTVSEIGMNLNGIDTQGENIADNAGIKLAYFAYNKWVSKFGEEQPLPGLNYTPNQLFWISSAYVWCSKASRKEIRQSVTADHHAYSKFRVIGALSNNEQFARDFNCPVGSKMNPKHKCSIW